MPRRALAIHEAAPREEFEHVMAGLENLPLKGGATPHEIAHAFFGLRSGKSSDGGDSRCHDFSPASDP